MTLPASCPCSSTLTVSFSSYCGILTSSDFVLCSVSFALHNMDRGWLGTPIDELNRMPQCAPPLSHLKVVPNHTVTVRVSQQPPVLFVSFVVKNTAAIEIMCMWT